MPFPHRITHPSFDIIGELPTEYVQAIPPHDVTGGLHASTEQHYMEIGDYIVECARSSGAVIPKPDHMFVAEVVLAPGGRGHASWHTDPIGYAATSWGLGTQEVAGHYTRRQMYQLMREYPEEFPGNSRRLSQNPLVEALLAVGLETVLDALPNIRTRHIPERSIILSSVKNLVVHRSPYNTKDFTINRGFCGAKIENCG